MFNRKKVNKTEDEHRKKCLAIIEKTKADIPPEWTKIGEYAIGGLLGLGFSKDEQYLLVLSSQGRGVFNCLTREKVSRDNQEDGSWYNSQQLTCQGIRQIENETINIAGLDGGGLRNSNDKGDCLNLVSPYWPKQEIILSTNWKHYLSEDDLKFNYKIWAGYEPRAYGFSPSGSIAIIAESSDLVIYTIK